MSPFGRPLGLRTQLVAAFVLLSVLATVLVALSAIWLRRQALVDAATEGALAQLEDDLLVAGARVNDLGVLDVSTDGDSVRLLSDEALGALGSQLAPDDGSAVLLVQPGGDSVYRSDVATGPDLVPADLQEVVADGLLGHARVARGDRVELVVGGRIAADGLAIYRFEDLGGIDDELAAMGRTLALAGTVPVVFASLFGLLLAGRLLRPVRRARDAARDLGDGRLETRLPVTGRDELADLSSSFNDMAISLQGTVEELRALEAQQRRFVADVSHELRTPLTALVAAVEVLEDELGLPDGAVSDDRREATRLAIDEVRGMRELVDDLMEITRFDAGRAQLDDAPTVVADAIEATLRRRDQGGSVTVEVPAGLRARVDRRRLDAIVANLVGNALSHGAPPVVIRAAAVDGALVIEVEDAGPGVPAAVRDRIFERFVKGDQARTRSGGSGLGLAIARENARLHGGDVVLAATGPSGTALRCTFPDRVLTVLGGIVTNEDHTPPAAGDDTVAVGSPVTTEADA